MQFCGNRRIAIFGGLKLGPYPCYEDNFVRRLAFLRYYLIIRITVDCLRQLYGNGKCQWIRLHGGDNRESLAGVLNTTLVMVLYFRDRSILYIFVEMP